MLQVRTFASGSSGNCVFVSDGSTHLLLDAGISCRRITANLNVLGLTPGDLDGILLTHEHSDHIAGLNTLLKHHPIPVYATGGTGRAICYRMAGIEEHLHTVVPGQPFSLGTLTVEAFPTSHDALESCGYAVSDPVARMALCTDLGYVSEEVLAGIGNAGLLIAETNHDVDLLRAGPYPAPLKARILSQKGHLCNEAGAELICHCVRQGCRTVLLAHLSAENNTPAKARQAVCRALLQAGIDPEQDVTVAVAPRSEASPTYLVSKEGALC